ncbi:MAG: thiol:disulfide interchange protein DsbA/DsbL, partial [Vitreoscilla sp.]|nr:thiol:disulfide interchange protein DsbA/DsbL [Polaromonas sp.]
MQRREFSISAATLAATAALATTAQAQGKPPQEGADFLVLDKPAPTEAPAGKIEVVEFFWYSCPHCNRFEPQLEEWVKKMPKDVVLRRAPVSFRPDFEPQQRLYYVLESMGKVEELHKKVFNAIHVERQPLNTADMVATWAEKQGIDKAKFIEAYNSF